MVGINQENYGFWIFYTSTNHLKTDFCQKHQFECIHTTVVIGMAPEFYTTKLITSNLQNYFIDELLSILSWSFPSFFIT